MKKYLETIFLQLKNCQNSTIFQKGKFEILQTNIPSKRRIRSYNNSKLEYLYNNTCTCEYMFKYFVLYELKEEQCFKPLLFLHININVKFLK